MNIFLFIAVILILTYLLGQLLEKLHIPWIFAALLLGVGLAVKNPFLDITNSNTFDFLSQTGMYMLLFLIGLEVNIKKLREKGSFILKSAFFVVLLEMCFGSVFIHYYFNYNWGISLLVSLSFATVGEAILIPILHEFGIVNSNLGQTIIGIGTADDILEILALILAGIAVGTQVEGNIWITLFALLLLFLMSASLAKVKKKSTRFKLDGIETTFLLVLFVFFLFVGVGVFAAAAPLAAFLAGISIKSFLPESRLKFIESEINSLAYGFFAPFFFIEVGSKLSMEYLISSPMAIILITSISSFAKLIGSYIIGKDELGSKGSILLGLGLSVRFSSSIIVVKFLLDHSIIKADLYSVIIASSIIFKFVLPVLFSRLLVKWNFTKQ